MTPADVQYVVLAIIPHTVSSHAYALVAFGVTMGTTRLPSINKAKRACGEERCR